MHILFQTQWLHNEAAKAICWTLIHSLWQGILVAVMAGVAISFTKKTTAVLRYNVLTALFLLFVIIVSVTFVYEWKGATGNTNSYVSVTQEVSTVDQKTTDKVVDAASPITLPEKLVLYFDEHAPLVVLVWMIFVLGHFIKLLSGLNYIHQIRHRGIYVVPEIWKKRLAELKHQLGILQQVVLQQSGIVKVPVVIGLTKPLILIPLSLLTNLLLRTSNLFCCMS